MGQKVNPNGMRLGIINSWNSLWYSNKKNYSVNLYSDLKIRNFLKSKLINLFVSKIVIIKNIKNIKVIIYTSRPNSVIKNKYNVKKLCEKIKKIININIKINMFEIKKPEIDSKLVANNIKLQLEQRIMLKYIIKKTIKNAIKNGAIGIKIQVSGRIGGIEIAKTEWYRKGRVPLHTLRANIDYNTSIANTTYGTIGIKVWIFNGEILDIKSFFKKQILKKYKI
ncbi:30S ribosomal protein S3 [Enterobacterales bacterium endosymbiont of Anomoneura mori]|uniref:30S ribosomal protein S3 n=1 Tax=Enterobacterales bacterium endosymbiont of Anomoneura mori TaxID=3132096 RepID=UPI00399CA62A